MTNLITSILVIFAVMVEYDSVLAEQNPHMLQTLPDNGNSDIPIEIRKPPICPGPCSGEDVYCHIANVENDNTFYRCEDGETTLIHCPEGHFFDQFEGVCMLDNDEDEDELDDDFEEKETKLQLSPSQVETVNVGNPKVAPASKGPTRPFGQFNDGNSLNAQKSQDTSSTIEQFNADDPLFVTEEAQFNKFDGFDKDGFITEETEFNGDPLELILLALTRQVAQIEGMMRVLVPKVDMIDSKINILTNELTNTMSKKCLNTLLSGDDFEDSLGRPVENHVQPNHSDNDDSFSDTGVESGILAGGQNIKAVDDQPIADPLKSPDTTVVRNGIIKDNTIARKLLSKHLKSI